MFKFLVFCFLSAVTLVLTERVNEMKIEKGFSWRNCNETNVPVLFRKLSVAPNPVKYGQNIYLSAQVYVSHDVGTTSTVKADIVANEVFQGQRFDMCQYKPDACHIEDVCKKVSQMKIPCPDIVKKMGSNCKCPLKKNTYAVKDIPIKIPNSSVQLEGQFEVTIKLKESDKPMGCLYVEFCLGECSEN